MMTHSDAGQHKRGILGLLLGGFLVLLILAAPVLFLNANADSITFEAEAGALVAPFVATDSTISQDVETADPTQGGRASYTFEVPQAGDYVVTMVLDAPSTASNSVFVNIDGEPHDPAMVWDIPPTQGFEERTVAWRGAGSPEANEFAPKVFSLAAGQHELIVRGRELGVKLDRLSIALQQFRAEPVTPEASAEPSPPPPSAEPSAEPSPPPPSAESPAEPSPPPPSAEPVVLPMAFEAEAGGVVAPFVAADGVVSQGVETADPNQGGRAAYAFDVPAAGDYVVTMVLDAPSTASNSVFVNIDGEPQAPAMVWDIPPTQGLQERVVAWRGAGSAEASEFAPKVFSLAAGRHELIVRGRELGVKLDRIAVVPFTAPVPSTLPVPTAVPPTAVPPTPVPPTAVPPAPMAFEAEAGSIAAPFTAANGVVSQGVETADPNQGGRAVYTFEVPQAGDYVVTMVVNAPSQAENSLFVNVDGETQNPTMIWDIPTTTGAQARTVGWRGTGSAQTSQFATKIFSLTPGRHQLVVRGRERGVQIDRIAIVPAAQAVPNPTPAPSAQPSSTPAPSPTPAPSVQPLPTPSPAPGVGNPVNGRVFYVSRNGSNADGLSWATAWNELGNINWGVIKPGDTILIDGGATEMVYRTPLAPTVSGTPDKKISIRLASDAGRNGKVVIFGGRAAPLPYCGQTGYNYDKSAQTVGVYLQGRSWITLDGTKWRGITIYGFNKYGVWLSSSSNNILVRNVHIYDNGLAYQSGSQWFPDQEGVSLSGTNITFERAIVNDNGQDSFQSGGGVKNFTLRQSWLYNSRKKPDGSSWNYCRHPDGIQIWGGGDQYGVTVQDSVIGPNFMQGFILGDRKSDGSYATIHNVLIQNTLMYGSGNANVLWKDSGATKPTNWKLDRVTSVRAKDAQWHNVILSGSPTITNSIFMGGRSMSVPSGGSYSNNCQWQVSYGTRVGREADPSFANPGGSNYSLGGSTGCPGLGSSITSPDQLLSLP